MLSLHTDMLRSTRWNILLCLYFHLFLHDAWQKKPQEKGKVAGRNICCPSNQPQSNPQLPLGNVHVPYRSEEKWIKREVSILDVTEWNRFSANVHEKTESHASKAGCLDIRNQDVESDIYISITAELKSNSEGAFNLEFKL